ncbi:ThiF family adenylyltransferase [Virgibacillus kimchii]
MNKERYTRQILFQSIGEPGQKKLENSTVLVVGAGALGTVICNHLVRAGIGKIRIIDRDYVEISNLQRQMLFEEEDVEKALPKAVAIKEKLQKINSNVIIEAITGNASTENIAALAAGVDVVLDGTDNFATRYLLNDICYKKNIPYSYGGVVSSRGMTAFFIPNETPCMRCVIKEGGDSGQTCDTVGVISPAVDMVSSLQVTETLKYLTGNKDRLRNTLYTFDHWLNYQYEIKLANNNPDCPTCQKQDFPSLKLKAETRETVLCGRDTVQIHEKKEMDLAVWEDRLKRIASTKRTPFLLKAEIDHQTSFVLFPDGRVLVQGTEDIISARTLYDRYIGS